MTSHELAAKLLALPNKQIIFNEEYDDCEVSVEREYIYLDTVREEDIPWGEDA